jgi:hypothetical protein
LFTTTFFLTCEAAAYVALPAWFAVSVQVPAPRMLATFPATVQMAGVVDANTTGFPEPPPVAPSVIVAPGL